MSYKKLKQDDTVCISDCLNCDYFILRRYDVCSPENSTYFLDTYESIWAAERETQRTLLKRANARKYSVSSIQYSEWFKMLRVNASNNLLTSSKREAV
jgi:hypothetical protein